MEKDDSNSRSRLEYLNKAHFTLITRDVKSASGLGDDSIPPNSGAL